MSRTSMLLFASLAMGSWALWAILSERALRTVPVAPAVMASFAAGTAVAAGYLLVRGDFAAEPAGLAFAALGGAAMSAGMISYYAALGLGSVGIATTVAALYFLPVTVIGVVFLGDPLGITDVGGILAAAVAIALFVW